ncbi:unnamed protein product [Rhizoctonia solani]|uniref:Uncharacterized protein n=1 Tax=Rhizoctonia solani TaxID=456999 RepID=A0A8H3DCG7_9AGAM|nr:unnamed protein product [Rhizoctonia solani]CAE6520293.1 unnamed protein product [Rhizoctonia solani]
MPRKLVCVFGTEFYRDHANSRLLIKYMVCNKYKQLVHYAWSDVPLSVESAPPKSSGFKRLLRRRTKTVQKVSPPLYTQAVSDTYGFLSENYQPGDEVILFPVTGLEEDWIVLRAAARVLIEHLEAGTEPARVAPAPDPATDKDREIFGDRPKAEPPNHILGKRIESSLAVVYRATDSVTEINNFLLQEFPLSVKQIFTFNWSTGRENYCNTFRDDVGQVTSREVCYFKDIQWHIPVVTNATMGFIDYQRVHTKAWESVRHSTPRTLISLPAPLIPERPPPVTASPITPRKLSFAISFGRKQNSAPRSSTLPNLRTARRSSTLMSGYTTGRRSDTLMSGFTTNPLATPISSPPVTPNSASPFIPSPHSGLTSHLSGSPHTSTNITQSPRGSADSTHSSRISIDTTHPPLREAYNSLPGMTKHQVWTYPAFRDAEGNYALPERVVWRSLRE